MSVVWLQIISLVYIVLLNLIYFSKKRIETLENSVYKNLMISNIIGLLIELGCFFSVSHMDQFPILNLVITKALLVYYMVFLMMYTFYVFIISYNSEINKTNNKFLKRLRIICTLFCIVNSAILCILPMDYFNNGMYVYSYGLSVKYLSGMLVFLLFVWFIALIRHFKNVKTKKYIPIIVFILLAVIGGAIQSKYPWLLLTTPIETLVLFLMYFTIENPDTKMIEELNENRRLIEQTNEDKSNFLFKMAQEVRQPIDDIIRANDIMKQSDDKELINKGIKYIDYSAKQLKSIVNNVLGVTSIDSYNIKMSSNTYDVKTLFAELISRYAPETKKKVEFRPNINKNIPKLLYGDGVKLKQVIATVLENAIKYTKEGFIDFSVDAIIKNDICRLIISIEDSGIGMSIDKVNELLSLDQELTSEDAKTLDQVNLNLNIATKVIKLLGGHMIIKSEDGKGSEFIIVVEQKIKEDKLFKQNIKIEEYSNILSKNKRILLVDDSKEFIEEISQELKKYDVDIVTTMYGNDCVEKIKSKQKYDLILLDDDMDPDTGLATLKELQKINKFKTPVIVMLEKNKDAIKEHYIEDGFKDYLLKFKIETDTKRIIEKYL